MSKVERVLGRLEALIERYRGLRQLRLPAERLLAEELGFSRSTLGKALGILEAQGVVERRVGSGTFVVERQTTAPLTVAVVMRAAYKCTDSHFRLIVDAVSAYAARHDLRIRIFDRLLELFQQSPDDHPLLRALRAGEVQGVLVTSRMPLSLLGQITTLAPAVSINNIFGDGSEVPCFSCDYFRAGFIGGKHLLEHGHRNIAFLTETLEHPESVFDLSGFRSALESYAITLPEQNILETKLHLPIMRSRILNFFRQSNCTACFVRSCSLAAQLVPLLEKTGRRLPDDLSIVTAGNCQSIRQSSIRLTTVDNRLAEMCEMGLQRLTELMTGQNTATSSGLTLLRPHLLEFDSVRFLPTPSLSPTPPTQDSRP